MHVPKFGDFHHLSLAKTMPNACLEMSNNGEYEKMSSGKIDQLSAKRKMSTNGLKGNCYKQMAHVCFW